MSRCLKSTKNMKYKWLVFFVLFFKYNIFDTFASVLFLFCPTKTCRLKSVCVCVCVCACVYSRPVLLCKKISVSSTSYAWLLTTESNTSWQNRPARKSVVGYVLCILLCVLHRLQHSSVRLSNNKTEFILNFKIRVNKMHFCSEYLHLCFL